MEVSEQFFLTLLDIALIQMASTLQLTEYIIISTNIFTVAKHFFKHITGVHFNKRGHRGDFWDDLSYEGYYNWTDSLVEDYEAADYKKLDPWNSLADAHIDHSQAINDDIADIVGVKMAYNAYQKYLDDLKKEGKKEKILPGLKQYTPQQLFWMKYANVCLKQITINLFH